MPAARVRRIPNPARKLSHARPRPSPRDALYCRAMTQAYVPEGSLTFQHALALVAERRSGRQALSEREHLRIAAGGNLALHAFRVPGEPGETPQDLAARAKHTQEAAHWLRHRLAAGEVKAHFVCTVVGLLDIAPAWWTGGDFAHIARTGRPRDGFLHNGTWFQGHIVVPQATLEAALDRAKEGIPFTAAPAPARNTGGRPKTYDYEWLALEVAHIYFNTQKPPATREALIKELQLRYDAKFNRMPDKATLKPFVRQVFERLGLGDPKQ